MEFKYARRMEHLQASEIREILKVTERPDIISFAGGLPAPELFPVEEILNVNRIVLDQGSSIYYHRGIRALAGVDCRAYELTPGNFL